MHTSINRMVSVIALLLTLSASCLHAQTWGALGTGLGLNSQFGVASVHALQVVSGDLYAGGSFAAPGGNYGIARWNGSSWNSVGGGANASVLALAALNGVVYAGGDLTSVGGVSVNRIAKWNGTSWSALGTGMNGFVYALAAKGTKVYVGGSFTTAGGVTVNRIAYWETTDSTWHAMGSGLDNDVFAIAITDNDTVYAGGQFSNLLRKWNPGTSSWDALANGPSGGTTPVIRALAAKGNHLYVGGKFTTVGSPAITVRGIAKWSGSAWSGLTTQPWVSDGTVRAIAWNGPFQMCATGYLPENPDTSSTRDQIYLLENGDSGTWSTTAMTSGLYRQFYSGEYGRALAVSSSGDKVYVGGFFDSAGGVSGTLNVAVWNVPTTVNIVGYYPAWEEGTWGNFVLTRTGSTASVLDVSYSASGDATPELDYNDTPYGEWGGNATFPAGYSQLDVIIVGVEDLEVEGTESIVLSLTPSASYTIGSPSSGSIYLYDND